MGITINDELTFNHGLTNSNSYGSFGVSELHIHKSLDANNQTIFVLTCEGRVWVSKEFRDSNAGSSLQRDRITLNITPDQLNGNLYVLLYNEWKNQFTSVNDDN